MRRLCLHRAVDEARRTWRRGAGCLLAVAALAACGGRPAPAPPPAAAPVQALAAAPTPPPPPPPTPIPPPARPAPPPKPPVPAAVPASTWLASPHGSILTYDRPDGAVIGSAGFWYGYRMTMPILEQQGQWLRIRLPERPNGSTAWVRGEDVAISSTPYRILVRLAHTDLTVYKDGRPLFTAPVGVGKASTPTPPGSFFVAVIEQPGPPGYGPVVLDTSGHSEAIESWQGMGDAITAIHGPVSAASAARIGTTGTAISNGCIRMHDADQRRLAEITLGTPVDIVP
jgi:lipoprotein-anchoring transpeptidase ErfK/SrfK